MGEGLRMVYLRTVPDAWHAKVLAARLGAEGIVTHLQGPVSGPYPFGAVSVHVEAAQADLAADLLLADEVESAFSCCTVLSGDDILPSPRRRWAEGVEVVVTPEDDLDLRPFDEAGAAAHRPVSRKLRAVAAFAAVMMAGAPVLAHFMT